MFFEKAKDGLYALKVESICFPNAKQEKCKALYPDRD